ncbi:mercuric reductase [Pedobacter gandavensis]|uniref:FAD-containing oxidoreductase n=1 Tax=Pedobacter gandavensis TaxID=2679963 RepID=A0ABR6EQT9_9SPHI|nr:mercuric reductase [Pedobacter gandavensis]MBB2147609.1 FAD-containing oxidoreductase [Pedobacter gandavensis]
MKHYDAIIIGAGQAGVPLAKKLAEAGKKTAIVEQRMVGGTCINDGCTPTKTIIASAHAAHQAGMAGHLGVEIGSVKVDLKKIKKRKDEIVDSFRNGAQKGIFSTKGLDLIQGSATFSGPKELTIATSTGEQLVFSADWIFINTGAQPKIPELKGLNDINYLTSTSILDLTEIPEHLVVLGGNYIGLEFAQAFQRFGSKVTVLEKSSKIMGREDEDVSSEMTKILEDEGLEILTNTTIKEVKEELKVLQIQLSSSTKTKTVKASHLLIAIGRSPQTSSLNLDIPGVKTDEQGYILVNERLETNVKGVYALGDVNGGPAFTHIAYNDYTIVYRNLIEKGKHSTKDRQVPYCMFTDPQLGRIGLSEAAAKAKGLDFKVAKIPMSQVARGIETGQTLGFMKAIVDPKSKKILGASILAAEAGEIMAVLQMAMAGGITYDKIRYGVFAHPTFSESLNNLFMKLD